MGKALRLKYLGGRCDVTELLEDLGTLREKRWASLPWEMPKSSMDACWWITNLPVQDGGGVAECDFSVAPKLLCKSLAYLRVELHQHSVANIAKLRLERRRRRDLNVATVQCLDKTHIGKDTLVQSSGLP